MTLQPNEFSLQFKNILRIEDTYTVFNQFTRNIDAHLFSAPEHSQPAQHYCFCIFGVHQTAGIVSKRVSLP